MEFHTIWDTFYTLHLEELIKDTWNSISTETLTAEVIKSLADIFTLRCARMYWFKDLIKLPDGDEKDERLIIDFTNITKRHLQFVIPAYLNFIKNEIKVRNTSSNEINKTMSFIYKAPFQPDPDLTQEEGMNKIGRADTVSPMLNQILNYSLYNFKNVELDSWYREIESLFQTLY